MCVDKLPEHLTQVFLFPSRCFARMQTQLPQLPFWPVNVNASVNNIGAIYNRRVMLALYFDKVLEVWLDVVKGASRSHGVVRVSFWFRYTCCNHVDKHLFVHSYIDLFIKHLRAYCVQALLDFSLLERFSKILIFLLYGSIGNEWFDKNYLG